MFVCLSYRVFLALFERSCCFCLFLAFLLLFPFPNLPCLGEFCFEFFILSAAYALPPLLIFTIVYLLIFVFFFVLVSILPSVHLIERLSTFFLSNQRARVCVLSFLSMILCSNYFLGVLICVLFVFAFPHFQSSPPRPVPLQSFLAHERRNC